jgi:1-acyl-sn-glycerol-3-phosphate acyltransferase
MKFFDISSLSHDELTRFAEEPNHQKERIRLIQGHHAFVGDIKQLEPERVRRVHPMHFWQEMICILVFLFGVPGAAFTLPVICFAIYYFGGLQYLVYAVSVLAPLAVIKIKFQNKHLYSWACHGFLQYFSFKVLFDDYIPENRASILVAPPHGVFPFGNIITMLAFPSINGFPFSGVASSAALRTPIFRQVLEYIGVVDADRETCNRVLSRGGVIGISTGGVAEVFETDPDHNDGEGDECIVLKSRKGLCKLALRTGADVVPCYLFGNTKLYSLYTGGPLASINKTLSRAIGFAIILFWGRWFLPVPFREPVLGVLTKPIIVKKVEGEPTQDQIDTLHAELCKRMIDLFNKYKVVYGWKKKRLVIK